MLKQQEQILQEMLDLLDKNNLLASINKIYLFGSRARGDAAPRSDIDLAISCPAIDDKTWLAILDTINETETLLKIDIIKLEEASAELRHNILREGKIIYECKKDPTHSR